MAKRMKKADATPAANEISPDDLKRVIKEYGKQVANAAEYQGLAGQAIKTFVERHNIPRGAMRDTLRKSKMEVQKMQAEMRQQIELWFKAGFFDQIDAFDDILDRMEAIVDVVRGRKDARPAQDSVVTGLIQ